MADTTLMDIDEEPLQKSAQIDKGKAKLVAEESSMKLGPWVEKYRPQSLSDVAAHKDIIDTIDRLTSENKLPHLLLYGPPGTGKTSTVLAIARKLYGNRYPNMILELNASDDRGIDVVRQQIQDFASTQSFLFGTGKSRTTKRTSKKGNNQDSQRATHSSYDIYLCFKDHNASLQGRTWCL
eukprot:TRINITY_DN12013_c0_g1_i2.p1 TRINITY_DN12013_c0_g1~~TRINITY_DN12013_c0_g1_i2.p1  ORF type:complete len:181 (-),score=21.40 TRINITY_DN12013_c0_g1_i2:4-546(-)